VANVLPGQFRVELEPGLTVTRLLPAIVEETWWLAWVFTGPALRRLNFEPSLDGSIHNSELLRRNRSAVGLRQASGEPLSVRWSGGGNESENEERIRIPLGLTSAVHVRYGWDVELASEELPLHTR
jgi:hypothetical protein